MLNLLKNIYEDNGFIINNLIKAKVITRSEVVECVLDTNQSYLIYYVAKYVKGLSRKYIDRLTDKLIELKSIKYIYDFAKNVNRAPIEKLASFMMEYGTADNIYNFAKNVDGSPVDEMAVVIIDKGIGEYIYKFAINVDGAPVCLLVDALAKLDEGYYLAEIAKITNNKEIKNKIFNIILNEMNNAKYIYNYAKVIGAAPIDVLVDALIRIGNPEYIYYFARDIKRAPIDKLARAIIEINDPEYIYYFAKGVVGAPVELLTDAIIKCGNITYMELFVHINNVSKEKVKTAINRLIVGGMSDDERLIYLFDLARNNDVKVIEYSSDIYRKMFVDDSSVKARKRIR